MLAILSSCLWAGTSLRWLTLSWTRVVMLGWERIECVLQGESSYTGSTKTAKNGLVVVVEHTRT